jgi:hypothetical protein
MPRQSSLTPDILDLAVAGIDAKINELKQQREQLLAGRGGTSQAATTPPPAAAKRGRGFKKGGQMSAEARRMISEKLKARWAERKRAAKKAAKGKKAAGRKKAAAKPQGGGAGDTGQQ